jgi:glycosyltransferase involved in cell wall biosynthesis
MRLLIDATVAGDRISGVERYAVEVSGRLARIKAAEGWQVSLLVRRGALAAWHGRLADRPELAIESPFASSLLTQQLWIPHMLRKTRADVAFFPGFPPSPLVFAHRGLRTVRTIFDAVMWSSPETTSRKNSLYYRPLEKYGARRYASVHTISDDARAELTRYLPWLSGRITVSGCGVSGLAIPDGKGPHAFGIDGDDLLFVGTLEPRKNLPFLLGVFAEVRKVQPNLRLVLAGRPGWGAAEVTAAIAALGLEQAVVLTGAISDAMLSALYRDARALVYPSLYEGFGLPVAEAMGCGVPVISSDTSSLPEVGGDAAILLSPTDQTAWVCATLNVLADAELRAGMVARGRRQAKKFDWDAVAARVGEAL